MPSFFVQTEDGAVVELKRRVELGEPVWNGRRFSPAWRLCSDHPQVRYLAEYTRQAVERYNRRRWKAAGPGVAAANRPQLRCLPGGRADDGWQP
jgi:hypothetical protein